MAGKVICSAEHSSGFFCVLRDGHDGDHLSIDNSKLWRGTPGAPIRWPRGKSLLSSPTGECCMDCGAMRMIRTGTCLTCLACGSTSGGCS